MRDVAEDTDELAVTLTEIVCDELLKTVLLNEVEAVDKALALADIDTVPVRENEIDALPLSASEAVTDADAGTDVVTVMLTLEDAIWEVEAVDERDALMLVVAVELNVIEAVADEVAKSAGEVELLPLDEND